jgi:hypothetical protein
MIESFLEKRKPKERQWEEMTKGRGTKKSTRILVE